jgi:hypothetical protein
MAVEMKHESSARDDIVLAASDHLCVETGVPAVKVAYLEPSSYPSPQRHIGAAAESQHSAVRKSRRLIRESVVTIETLFVQCVACTPGDVG